MTEPHEPHYGRTSKPGPGATDRPVVEVEETTPDEVRTGPVRSDPSLPRVRRPVDVSIVVPVQSPEAEVRDVTHALGAQLDRMGKSWEIIFVFDGVEGVAWEAVQQLHAERGHQIKTILFKSAFGESVCLSAAFERADGALLLTSPQYVQVDPLELERMLAAIDGGADFVTPWRHPRVDPVLNRIQSGFFNWVIRQIIRGEFHDLNCYFRLIRREVLEEISIYGDMYRFLPVMAFRQGFHVVEVRVRHLTEWGKAGFFGVGVYIRRFLDVLAVMFLTKFTLKPLRFFGTLGGFSALMGGGICTYLAVQKLFFDVSISGKPMLVAGVMLLVLGAQIIGFGLVGEIIIFSQARNLKEYRIERIYE